MKTPVSVVEQILLLGKIKINYKNHNGYQSVMDLFASYFGFFKWYDGERDVFNYDCSMVNTTKIKKWRTFREDNESCVDCSSSC